MSIEYQIDDALGVVNSDKYQIQDTDETFSKWKKLQSDFAVRFGEFTSVDHKDYDFADWHHGINYLPVYLYNEGFYNAKFIPQVRKILKDNMNSFAQFECYDKNQELIGSFQVYTDIVRFDHLAESSGLIVKLGLSER